MMANKGTELATESISGCVLQLYVWLNNPEEAGSFALGSIGISALTTGFSSAMIAFDFDVDDPHRRNQPNFYGSIPDDNGARGRCFVLMTLISALHNLSRSVGCYLLAAAENKSLVLYIVGSEMFLYLLFKLARSDVMFWPRMEGTVAIMISMVQRVCVKMIVDFTGCLHMRHPFELGKLGAQSQENVTTSANHTAVVLTSSFLPPPFFLLFFLFSFLMQEEPLSP